MAAEDICRLNELPESLLCSNILSRLPLIDAVRSSILCTEWRYLWKKIPHLHFSPDFVRHIGMSSTRRLLEDLSIRQTMESILVQHDTPLESFGFHVCRNFSRCGFSSRFFDIEQCIKYAARKEVQRMILEVVPDLQGTKTRLPATVFGCRTLLHLQLVGLTIPEIPTLSGNFMFLTTCLLRNIINLSDHRLQRFVELCPALEKLVLVSCRELIHLRVQAANLKCFILAGCSCLESVTADCPQLLQLKTRNVSSFYELQINSYSLVELKLRGCYKLIKLQLNSSVFVKKAGSLERLLIGRQSDVESLRKLSLECRYSKLVGIFSGLEELEVSPCMMCTAMERGEEMEKVSDFTFPNLKNAYLDILFDGREEDLAGLRFLLRNSPLLKNLTLNLSYCSQKFKKQVLAMKRVSAEVEIKMLDEDNDEHEMEYSEETEGLDRCGYGGYGSHKNDAEDNNYLYSLN